MASPCWNLQSDCESEVLDLEYNSALPSVCDVRRTDAAVKVEDDPVVLDGEGVEVVDTLSKKRAGRFRDCLDVGRTRPCLFRPEWATTNLESKHRPPNCLVDSIEATRRQDPCEASLERPPPVYPLLEKLVLPLKQDDREYQDVERLFLGGLGQFASGTVVTGVARDSSARGQARLQAFEKVKDLTRKARGDENERFAWHGTSKAGVSGIFLHGFGQPRIPKNGSAYGVGVYLAPEGHSHVSAIYADNDENGEQHVVLCKVVLGASELVAYGSDQFHPSSEEFDSGVDDSVSPRRLIIWSTSMNTHILPMYVVSFRLPPCWHSRMAAHHGKRALAHSPAPCSRRHFTGRQKCDEANSGTGSASFCKRGPSSPFIWFPHLFLLLSPLLSSDRLAHLKHCHREFQAKRLSRPQFINHLRNLVGDHRLVHAIKLLQGSQISKAREQGKFETPISCTASKEMKCETPLSFTAAEKIERGTSLAFTVGGDVKCETPLSFTAAEKIEREASLSFTAGEKLKCETPLSFTVV